MKDIVTKIYESSQADKFDAKNKIAKLEKYAKEHGYDKIVFRDRTTNQGDFCIFLYNKKIQPKRYCVGFDGEWTAKSDTQWNFDNCIQAAYEYIDSYKV